MHNALSGPLNISKSESVRRRNTKKRKHFRVIWFKIIGIMNNTVTNKKLWNLHQQDQQSQNKHTRKHTFTTVMYPNLAWK